MNVYLEKYTQEKHLHLLHLMEFSRESLLETKATQLATLGLSPCEITYDCILGAKEAFVFRCNETHKIRGVFGVSYIYTADTKIGQPWFISDGLEREPQNHKGITKLAKCFIEDCKKTTDSRKMYNFCLSDKRITKWLEYLGFTISPVVISKNKIPMRAFSMEY